MYVYIIVPLSPLFGNQIFVFHHVLKTNVMLRTPKVIKCALEFLKIGQQIKLLTVLEICK